MDLETILTNSDYEYLIDHLYKPTKDIIELILAEEYEDDDILNVYTSTVYGICNAYLDYYYNSNYLTKDELQYLYNRGGILVFNEDKEKCLTVRELISICDENDNFETWFKNKIT